MTQTHAEKVKDQPKSTSLFAKIMIGLVMLDVAAYFYSSFAMKMITFLLINLAIGRFLWDYLEVDTKLKRYKWYRKFSFLMKMRSLRSHSKSLNQTQVFMVKHILGLPITLGESEIDSFSDLTNHFNVKWPYMVPVKDTKSPKITVRGRKVECISSYSYLDLTADERIQQAAIDATKSYSTGNHGPRMLCGNLEILEQLEEKIAKFFKRDSALVFSSGYLACMSVIAGIARKGDLVLMDKLSHASLKAGAKLSGGKMVYFNHNDFKDAERQIKAHANKYTNLIMVIEGVYSMDGDVGFLDEARVICDKYKGTLILDEAHSLGAIGKTGKGTEEMYGYKIAADVICGTFTKSMASVGGYITCGKKLRDFYTFYAPGVVFSAPLSAYHCGAAAKAFEILENEPERVEHLQANALYLRTKFVENGFNIGKTISCVIPVIFRDAIQCFAIHNWLLERGYFTGLVMAPACPVTAPRFRITASSNMTKEHMDNIVSIFIQARNENHENAELKELLDGL